METIDPAAFYSQFISTRSTRKNRLLSQRKQFGWWRLLCFVAGAGLLYLLWPLSLGIALLVIAAFTALFLFLVSRSVTIQQQLSQTERELQVAKEEGDIAALRFQHRFNGAGYLPKSHPYAHDLDIFGNASLYQYLHRTSSGPGRETFANWLLAPADNPTILQRQQAARETAANPEWSIGFQATGDAEKLESETAATLDRWLSEPPLFSKPIWKIIAIAVPAITLGSLLLYVFDVLSTPRFLALITLYLLIAFAITRKVQPAYVMLNKAVSQLNTLSAVLACLEHSGFNKGAWQQLLKRIAVNNNDLPASKRIRQLRQILDRFDVRLNPLVFIPLNAFLLWDLQVILQLEKWRREQRSSVHDWFHVIGEAEALNSLARTVFNHPAFTTPVLSDVPGHFEAKALVHPLIPASQAVSNDFATRGKPAVSLITGSNMAGKSTFLRAVGVNQVLAMAGSVAAAAELTVSNNRIMSSMRISDNLEENTSTFYAELNKLKVIIDAVKRQEPVFFLLDEILRGTNSHDRQTGSRALIEQMIRENGAGLLATHDLTLTELAGMYPGVICNYHFDVSVNGEELYFDYKLKTGVCQSMNASVLMKKIGIEM
ncbi:MAG: hypothetical protein QM664_07435 [Flavihumibacter sp.]